MNGWSIPSAQWQYDAHSVVARAAVEPSRADRQTMLDITGLLDEVVRPKDGMAYIARQWSPAAQEHVRSVTKVGNLE